MVPLRTKIDCGILRYGYHILFGGEHMYVSKERLQELLMEFTIMEGELCELLAQVSLERERFRASLDLRKESDVPREA